MDEAPRFRVREARLFLRQCITRLPFRFGIATLTQAPLALLRVQIETAEGRASEGFASDLLVPKWFEKDPTKTMLEDIESLIESAQQAMQSARDAGDAGTAWRLHEHLGARCDDPSDASMATPPLVAGFGRALVERAAIDAVCRATERSFFNALANNLFGVPEEIASALDLPNEPAGTVHLRHTVGMADTLRTADIKEADRVNDGLPESLEDDISTYGLTHFKIKVAGDLDSDVDRLLRIADLLQRRVGPDARITLDGNEQFASIGLLVELIERLQHDARGSYLLDRLLLIEQPLARSHTFESDRHDGMDRLADVAPIIIDEADGTIDAFPRAIELGYRGVSVKNCKGVFRALVNRARCAQSHGALIQSAEDLTTLPVIALQQDLCTVAALGLPHVERNGHHYFRGLDHLPDTDARDALAGHPDLYVRHNDQVSLHIDRGRLSLRSLQCTGYGHSTSPHTDYWDEVA